MTSHSHSPSRTLRGKKTAANPPSLASPAAHSSPTTFFLRSEKEMEKTIQRGRAPSRDTDDGMQKTPVGSLLADSSFGVQSLEDTIGSTSATRSDNILSRTSSNVSDLSADAGADVNMLASRKRKAGNPVHPKIMATGQRIISSEHYHHHAPSVSPMSHRSAESPFARRASPSSSVNLSQPLTPLRMSPRPESAMPSTPRTGSPKSLRLSDEEQSIASETGSQAIQSSCGGEELDDAEHVGKEDAMPQLVMPSISMPMRRPFTERGRQMGRLKIMVVGPQGVGKTSLIRSICRLSEDVAHLDSMSGSGSSLDVSDGQTQPTEQIVAIGASTRPYPAWWTDFESRRMPPRRKSMGDGVLERNLTFIDTPGFDGDRNVQEVRHYFADALARMGHMERLHDTELVGMLSGEGGLQVDVVLFLFDPSPAETLDTAQVELLKHLCKWTNVIPLIGHADTVETDDLGARKEQLSSDAKRSHIHPTDESAAASDVPLEPYAISSALGDDPETIDASILMSSGYLQPFLPSELSVLVSKLLEPDNMARWRHLSATKFLLWRQEHLASPLDLHKQTLLQSSHFEPGSPAITSTGSIVDEPSKVLVPYGSSSYFRSASPSASEGSAPFPTSNDNITATSAQALARYNDQTNKPSEPPFRQVRLAKWAQDLQRSLENERKRYAQIFSSSISPALTGHHSSTTAYSSDSEKAIISSSGNGNTSLTSRPPKGRLGGDLGIIDPSDPLGVLAFAQAFKRRGWFALQIAGTCGALGAAMWWMARNWAELQEWLGLSGWQGVGINGQPPAAGITMFAVPPPAASTLTSAGSGTVGRSWLDAGDWRNMLGMAR
ncbi:hypothetical protein BDY17DRAFT_245502 [Neohortaea acidophila]|uniref:Septin-type G domain-containing protein n=1 Tax=Neohortaea acidophila TaxID=245834 RepID=A0A6A6Q302_9PEZI|nr:uncharacterized protein BDY17DRAFT_245502 [Neohortaea acidophila]KAF2486675.1 hypothetical protein BDY17DRAFT_245502 [Neohortaea acidophila]